jgi:hypothetical protein
MIVCKIRSLSPHKKGLQRRIRRKTSVKPGRKHF